jgi:hypothetical protein
MANSRRVFFGTIIVLFACFVMIHAGVAAPYDIQFHSGTVRPALGVYDIPPSQGLASGNVHALVQLNDYLHAGDRERLAAAGITLLSYLPDRAYVASLSKNVTAAAAANLGVRHISAMLPAYKLHERVIAKELGKWSEYSNGQHVFAIQIMPDVSLDDARKALVAAGCELGNSFDIAHAVAAAFDPARAPEIASLDAVLFINEITPPLSPVNSTTRTRLHVNEVQTAPYNLNGDSVTVLVFDGMMVDSTHPDFGDRVTWIEDGTVSPDGFGHATHVAGTLGGSGANDGGAERGMAPAVRIISGKYDTPDNIIFWNNPGDFASDYRFARSTFRIEETTNSIGVNIEANFTYGYLCDWFGDYELCEQTLDALTLDTEGSPLTMFFAAGNDRNGSHCFLNYNSMSVPAAAKNVITVGATSPTDAVSSFSCAGPTDDGRLKPEVCATGQSVISTVPGGGYASADGTSMATPAVAGVGALLHQQWHRMFPGAPDPLPETVKAILINSATDIGLAGPDFLSGYGLVNALKAIQNMQLGGILESSLETDEDFAHPFTVDSVMSALDVSLAWSDIPAVGNVIPTLVNDLDLRLVDPNGTEYLPWVMRPASPGQPAQIGRDSVNVCERVHVVNPAVGNWTLHVTGRLNGSDRQSFGLSANVALVRVWASVSGHVRNTANQQSLLSRVMITGESQAMNTDTSGNYLLSVPGNSNYTVHAISYGFVPQDAQVTVTNGNVVHDFALATAQMGTINGTVTNQYGVPLQADVRFDFPNAPPTQVSTDANGFYTSQLPGANIYRVTVVFFGAEYPADVLVPENGTVTHDFTITNIHYAPAGPDSAGYFAYETTDPGLSAEYDWLEISPQVGGPGTAIPGTPSSNDWVANVDLPFNMRFYGQDNTLLEVGADGWIGVGNVPSNNRRYVNLPIPTDSIPNGIIALFWDDLAPYASNNPDSGDISYYHDAANGRFIIEYHHVPHYSPRTHQVTAQLIIWDQATRPTWTGDNEFQFQYQSVDYADSVQATDADATIGIENYTGTDGIQYVYNGDYDSHCFPLSPGYALRFTTGTGSAVPAPRASVTPEAFYLKPNYPNPFNPTTRIEYGLPRAADVRLDVFDLLGRSVATLHSGMQEAGVHTAMFDGKNLGSGVYYCRLKAGRFVQVQKMLLMR